MVFRVSLCSRRLQDHLGNRTAKNRFPGHPCFV
uniref:DUF1534 domain-containing protein n=1 Tax=Echinococcus granulosus TaxID=6210 RepID=A0A068WCB0_ECHGR|nr:hypothetical protein EgrG_001011200 [Echinococcus granulosus]